MSERQMARSGTRSKRWAWALLALCVAALSVTPALAQFGGLAEQAAVQDVQNELRGGGKKNNNPPPPPEPAQAASGQQEGEEAGDDAAPAPKAESSTLTDKWNDEHSIFRQTKLSLSWWKALLALIVFFAWVRTCDWVNRSAQIHELAHNVWNPVVVFPFVVAFLLQALIPNFLIDFALLVLAWGIPLGAYIATFNKSVEEHETVLTGDWFRFQLAQIGGLFGMKVAKEKQPDYLRGPQVDLEARGGDDSSADQANLLTARQSPGYVLVKELVSEMTRRGSNRVLMDYTAEVVNVRYLIDGVWHGGEPRDRESGDVMLAVIKQLANLNISERKKKQEGEFGAVYEKASYDCTIASQGVKTGERVVVSLRGGTLRGDFESLTELGMRDKLRDQWLEMMGHQRGVLVYSAMPEGGLTTLTNVGLTETDRLLRDFVAIEDMAEPELDIENIPAHRYDTAQGQTPAALIPSLSRKYPNVWVVRDFVDAESAKLMMDEVGLDRLVVTTVHAREAAEACLRLLKKKVPHKEFSAGVIGVLSTRLIRTLCTDCKVEYEPSPALLKKLRIPAGKVTKFFQPPKEDEIDKPCQTCAGIGYRGRTGLFELLVVDDQFREKLLKEPKIETLRQAARAAGMRTFQEEGILLVARGMTSLAELSRVLKG